jgi:hypothetical protein
MKDYSSYGKAKILGISSQDLQNLIIQILEHRKTIRKNKLSDAVLKHMKVDIRRSTREKFERKTFRALKSLVTNNIIREFKNRKDLGDEYIRVKLTPNYENRLSFPKSRRERISKFEDRDINSIEPIDDVLDSEVFERELPDLPDSDFDDDEEESVIEAEDDFSESKHEEKDDLLKVFLGKNSDMEENDLDDKSKPLGVQQKHLLQSLKESFDGNENIETYMSFAELRLKISTTSGYIVVLINSLGAKKEIIIRSFIPYFEEAIIDILRLLSHVDYQGTLCIEEFQNQDFFSIRETVDLTKYSHNEIIAIIEQLIYESVKLEEVIDRHL